MSITPGEVGLGWGLVSPFVTKPGFSSSSFICWAQSATAMIPPPSGRRWVMFLLYSLAEIKVRLKGRGEPFGISVMRKSEDGQQSWQRPSCRRSCLWAIEYLCLLSPQSVGCMSGTQTTRAGSQAAGSQRSCVLGFFLPLSSTSWSHNQMALRQRNRRQEPNLIHTYIWELRMPERAQRTHMQESLRDGQ